MNSLGLYPGASSDNCLQQKWRFENWPFVGPRWKSPTFSGVFGAAIDLVSSSRSSASRTMTR